MTETLQTLDRRIEAAEELHSVTRTMRGLAAVNVRHHEITATALDDYERIVEDGLQVVLRDGQIDRLPAERPPHDAPTALVVFGSNQGLCGSVNRDVVAHAATEIASRPAVTLVAAIGARLAAELDLAGLPAGDRWELPGTVEGITGRAEQLLLRADRWRRDDGIARVVLVFPRFRGRARGYEPTTVQLSPTDRDWLEHLAGRAWPSRSLPMFTMNWEELVADLIRQALFVRLNRSFAQTMASVAASRLAAMDEAQRNIEERLVELRQHHHQRRQAEITEELLDIVSGFDVLERSSARTARSLGDRARPITRPAARTRAAATPCAAP